MAMAGRRPSAEESALWRTAMRAVHPRRPAPSAPLEQKENPPAPVAAPVEPRGTGLDRRSAQRLKRGQMAIEARLDLHGLTQDEAHRALHRFIARMHEEGRRAVLIITGKGARDGVGGVLRQGVPRWLAEPACRASILAVEEAQSRHGGGGALYVLLRRRR
jgi:DNA-nicking Smr family endonuclease